MSDSSGEPGVTLSRLIAAERNAVSALELFKRMEAENAALRAKVEKLEQKCAQTDATIIQMRGQVYANLGNVRTG